MLVLISVLTAWYQAHKEHNISKPVFQFQTSVNSINLPPLPRPLLGFNPSSHQHPTVQSSGAGCLLTPQPFPFSSVTKTRNQKLSPRGWSRRASGSYVIMTSRRAIAASCPSSSGTYWRSEEWGTGSGAGGLESTQP